MNETARTRHDARVDARRAALRELLATLVAGHPAITWEVGAGHGHFLTNFAAEHPGELCIGIDIMSDRVERAARKQERARLPNLRFVRADAFDFLASLPDATRFSRVIVLFPDPWPKVRHHKNRLMQPPFLREVARRLTPEGRLYFRTDHVPYFDAARDALRSEPGWQFNEEPWPFEPQTIFQQRAPAWQSLAARHG